jgi:ABC-2 type transport system permease protein
MKILDIALKDLIRSFRSLFAIGMMVVAPLLITGLIYFAFGGLSKGSANVPAVKVGVVNLDALPDKSPLEAPLGNLIHDMFHDDSVKAWLTATDYADEAAARAAVDKQAVGVAVVVPARFTEQFLAGQTDTAVLILQDPTLTIGPLVVRNMVTSLLDGVAGGGIALKTVTERQKALGLTPDPAQIPELIGKYQTWYADFQRNLFHNPARAALVMVAPAAAGGAENTAQKMLGLVMAGMLIFFAFYTGAYAMMSILRETEEGTLARLFTTPTNRTAILTGKFLAVFLTVILQGIVLMTASHFAFGVNWGDPLSAGLALVGQVVAATGLGVLLIALVKTTRQAGPVLGAGLTTLGMLGGLFTVSIPSMPAAFAALANFTPQGWVLKGWRIVMNGQPAADLLMPVAVLVVMGGVMFALGAVLFRRRFAD